MRFVKKRTVINLVLFSAMVAVTALTWAGQVAGTVVHLSGPLMAKKADGSVKILARKSEVEQGDTLVAEKGTYAQIRFIDNSEITLRPDTTFKIEAFAYDEAKPDADSARFDLVKGGLRSVTGLLGKRNKEKFSLKTPTATIGIRGTTFIAQYVPPSTPSGPGKTPGVPMGAPQLKPGLHVFVVDGAIMVGNPSGSMNFTAGQFGFTPSFVQPPVVVPRDPGIQFTPPPSFNLGTVNGGTPNTMPEKSAAVDCEVR